ncbi:MAG TPA: hypothetical protein VLB32_05895 [Candidatus Acidoferrales bacterium]|nr:hypothetical protein [Candidatus Acidoferrales bacterium]
MKNRNAVALLLAPIAFLALLFFTSDRSLQASPHPDRYYRGGDYARSVAVVWALDSIKDGVSCHDSLRKYEREVNGVSRYDREYGRDYRGLSGDTTDAIAVTYEELAGACTDHNPHAAARQQAAYFLEGLRVER